MFVRQQFKCRIEIIRFSYLGGNQLDAQPFACAFGLLSSYDCLAASDVYD